MYFLHDCAISIDNYSSINKFYSLIIPSVLINAVTDTALKITRFLYCFTTSISYGVVNYSPWLWGTGISDAIFKNRECLTI